MNISNIKPLISKTGFFKNLKKVFNGEIRLKTLLKDSFCKKAEEPVKNIRHKGDSFTHVPEFMTQENNSLGVKVRNMKFSPEDEEKMSKMTFDEMYKYKANLIKKGKYTYK